MNTVQLLYGSGRSRQWWRATSAVNAASDNSKPATTSDSSALPFRMLLGFTFVLLLAPQQAFPVLAPLRIALLMAGLTLLTYAASRSSRKLPLLQAGAGIRPALLLAGWAVLCVPLSLWPGGSISFLFSEYFKTLAVFLLVANVVDSPLKLRQISWALVLMAVPLALTTLVNFDTGTFLAGSPRVVGYNAPLTANPNDMALMLNLILPFAIALFLDESRSFAKLLLAAVILLLVAAVIVTFSRAGFLTLAVIFLLYMWRLRKRKQRILIPLALLLVCVALPLVPASYYDRLGTITDIAADPTGSAQTRWSDTQTAIQLVVANPLIGAGPGMNIFAMNEARGATWTEVHNVYLQLAVELGVPGVVLYLLFFRSCLHNTQASLTISSMAPQMTTLFHLAEAIRVSLLAFAVAALFHPVAYDFYFYYIAGLAVAVRTICDRARLACQ